MAENHYVLVITICVQHKIEPVFLDDLYSIGLLDIVTL